MEPLTQTFYSKPFFVLLYLSISAIHLLVKHVIQRKQEKQNTLQEWVEMHKSYCGPRLGSWINYILAL